MSLIFNKKIAQDNDNHHDNIKLFYFYKFMINMMIMMIRRMWLRHNVQNNNHLNYFFIFQLSNNLWTYFFLLMNLFSYFHITSRDFSFIFFHQPHLWMFFSFCIATILVISQYFNLIFTVAIFITKFKEMIIQIDKKNYRCQENLHFLENNKNLLF